MASIGDLFIELGVKADTQTINRVGNGIKSLRNNLLLVSAAFTGAVVGIDRFVNSALNGVVALQNLNNQTGLSIEKLQRFQQAGQLSNLALSADQIAQSLGTAQKNLKLLAISRGNIAPFQMLGIDPRGNIDIFDVIDKLRGNIEGIDPSIRTSLISELGLSPDFINILKLSKDEFDALSENEFLSGRQRADIDKVGTSMKALQLRLKALKDQAVAKLAPELDKLVQQFFKWIKDNSAKIIDAITKIARGFAKFAKAIGNAFDLASRFVEKIAGMKNGITALAGAFALLALSISPFLLGLTAIILLLDDIAVFKAGGKSVIGELLKAFEDLPDFTKILGGVAIVAGLTKITGALLGMKAAANALLIPLGKIGLIGAGVVGALELGKAGGKKVSKKLEGTEIGEDVGNFLLGVKEAFRDEGIFSGLKALIGVSPDRGGAIPNQSINNANDRIGVINNNNTFNINGLQDPVGVRDELQRGFENVTQESLNRALATQGRGIR